MNSVVETEEKEAALLPCPFCGSSADRFEDEEVQCGNRMCPVRPSAYSLETWNTRTAAVSPTDAETAETIVIGWSDLTDLTSRIAHALAATRTAHGAKWQPMETAPKDGRTILLGYYNLSGKWRTLRGQWYSADMIMMDWEDPDEGEEGWYETSVQADDPPNVWPVTPTHWMPLPPAPTVNGETYE